MVIVWRRDDPQGQKKMESQRLDGVTTPSVLQKAGWGLALRWNPDLTQDLTQSVVEAVPQCHRSKTHTQHLPTRSNRRHNNHFNLDDLVLNDRGKQKSELTSKADV